MLSENLCIEVLEVFSKEVPQVAISDLVLDVEVHLCLYIFAYILLRCFFHVDAPLPLCNLLAPAQRHLHFLDAFHGRMRLVSGLIRVTVELSAYGIELLS